MPGPLVTLLTDFGLADAYVGVMKGVMLGINPRLALVDLTHDVAPQNVWQGAFILGTAWRFFPQGTIHVAVVDPEVGAERKALLVEADGHYFLAPDNGVLSFVLDNNPVRPELVEGRPTTSPVHGSTGSPRTGGFTQPYQASISPDVRVYTLSNPDYWRGTVSNTFHGRDVFAPAAAHLSLGVPMKEFGEPVSTLTLRTIPVPRREGDGLVGHVLHIDRFGNVVTNVTVDALAGSQGRVEVDVGGTTVRGLVKTYAQGQGLAALIGSHGYLELALTNGSAAESLGVRVGDEVRVRKL